MVGTFQFTEKYVGSAGSVSSKALKLNINAKESNMKWCKGDVTDQEI